MAGKNQPQGNHSTGQNWDLEEIQKLIDILVGREITDFEMEKGGFRIHIQRGLPQPQPGAAFPLPQSPGLFPNPESASRFPVALHPPSLAPETPPPPEAPADSAEGLHIIKSPIVGTYYSGSSPAAENFVKPGDVVQVGRVLCIIEAMKLMNEIESDVAGEVVRVYLENGQPVEYGQSLFAIKLSIKK